MTWYCTVDTDLISFFSQMSCIHLRIFPDKVAWMWKNLWNILIPGKSQFLVRLIKDGNIANFNVMKNKTTAFPTQKARPLRRENNS